MKLDWSHWLYGLISGFIGGGAGALTAGLSAMGITPESYNLGSTAHGLRHLLALMGATFLLSGIVTVAAFLKQSPLPAVEPEAPASVKPA